MKKYYNIFLFILFNLVALSSRAGESEQVYPIEINKETIDLKIGKITLIHNLDKYGEHQIIAILNDTIFGVLKFHKIINTDSAYIDSLYIEPTQRGFNFVRILASNILRQIFAIGIKKIFMHPNPFFKPTGSFIDYALHTGEERETYLKLLIKLYKSIGFDFADKKVQDEFVKLTNQNPTNLMFLNYADFIKKINIKAKL